MTAASEDVTSSFAAGTLASSRVRKRGAVHDFGGPLASGGESHPNSRAIIAHSNSDATERISLVGIFILMRETTLRKPGLNDET
jgi:hypothetical protein